MKPKRFPTPADRKQRLERDRLALLGNKHPKRRRR